ncbi:hypothetical protein BLA29_006224 [Euroglyphus maynei]|uniref:ABC-2 type transporter transmembrane domain-containing protein n=1 Tax=Euroglyphus maynei TaxID=6958 RepID=A0A1Y3BAI9_EURMA|nr:hypothetical protein BLA29_006224 [Euroglyphus maynei]
MIYTDGCVNIEDELNNTCNQTQEKEDEDFDLQASFIYVCFSNAMLFFLVLLQSALMFSKEIVYFCNEHKNGWYSTGVFYSMKILAEILSLIPALVIYTYLVDIYEPIHPYMFYWMLFFTFLSALAAQAFGHLVAILTLGNFVLLVISIPAIEVISLLISNMGTPVRRLHYIFQFFSNFAPTRFIIEAMFLLQYGFDRCRQKEVQKSLLKFKMEDDEHAHHETFFTYTIIMLIFNILIYRIVTLLLLLAKTNRYENRRKRALRIENSYQNLKPSNVIIPGLQCHHELTIKRIQV